MDLPLPHSEKWLLRIYLVVFFAGLFLFLATGYFQFFFAPFAFLYLITAGINWRVAWWMLLFCIPFSVHTTLQGGSLSLSLPDEPMMWIFLLLLPLLLAHNPHIISRWWLKDPLVVIVALQLLWLIVAVACSQVWFLSLKFLIAKVWYLACFFVFPLWVFRRREDFVRGFILILVPTCFTMLVIFFRHAATGFSFVKINDSIGKLYYNRVEYSTVLSMLLPLVYVAYRLCNDRSRSQRRLLAVLIVFFLVTIFFSFARAAILAVAFAFVIALAIRRRLVNIVMPCVYGAIAMLMIYLSTDHKYLDLRPNYERTYIHGNFTDNIIATFRGQDMSSMERIYRWIAAIRMSEDKPVVGYGPHSFYYFYKPYTITMFKTYGSANTEHSTTHNYFLYMLVEQGWPAMLLYALLVAVVFAQAQKTYFRFKNPFYRYVTLGLAATFAASFVNNFFSEMIETHKVGAIFYLSMALLVILDRKSRNAAIDEAA